MKWAFMPMAVCMCVRVCLTKRVACINDRGLVGTIQSLFYLTRMGIDSGFLMSLLVALIYPANAVAYVVY